MSVCLPDIHSFNYQIWIIMFLCTNVFNKTKNIIINNKKLIFIYYIYLLIYLLVNILFNRFVFLVIRIFRKVPIPQFMNITPKSYSMIGYMYSNSAGSCWGSQQKRSWSDLKSQLVDESHVNSPLTCHQDNPR